MKKAVITLVAMLALLCGCQANENTNASDYGDDISKAQEIAVISPDTAVVIGTITDTEEIEDFVSALDLDQWELKPLPDEASEIGSFGLAQEETIKLGQTDTDGTLYGDPFVHYQPCFWDRVFENIFPNAIFHHKSSQYQFGAITSDFGIGRAFIYIGKY